jgi:thiol-disulfide isomerase/thioredoxin
LQPDTSPSSLSSAPPAGEGELRTLDGSIVSVAGPRQRPLVAFFFAGWCASCIAEARALGQLHDALGDRVDIVAVSIDPNETAESLAAFRQAAGNPAVLWAIDATGATARRYKVQALDQTVVVNDAGRVVYEDFTPTSYEQLVKAVEKAF